MAENANDTKVTYTATHLARMLANHAARVHNRIAANIDALAAAAWAAGRSETAQAFEALAEDIRAKSGAVTVTTTDPVRQQLEEQVEDSPLPSDDPLPPHRDYDDFEEGEALIRARSTFGRRSPLTD